MAVGTASVILVVTIGLTGKQYILRQIQSIGANMIYADYQGGSQRIDSTPDPMTVEDVDAVRQQVPAVVAASPTIALNDRISVGGGRQSDILVLGVSAEYRRVRNLVLLAGRFFDQQDSSGRNKVGVITDKLAGKLFGSPSASIGQIIKLSGGLPFTVVGVFKESVDTFGQSEIQEDTMLIPYTVSRFFTPTNAVYEIYFSAATPQDVGPATEAIKRVLQSRHRAESVYSVQNLPQLLSVLGTVPAPQASQLDPVESLRYECDKSLTVLCGDGHPRLSVERSSTFAWALSPKTTKPGWLARLSHCGTGSSVLLDRQARMSKSGLSPLLTAQSAAQSRTANSGFMSKVSTRKQNPRTSVTSPLPDSPT